MTIVTISPKFQIVIPQAIREALALKSGQRVKLLQHNDRIELIPLKPARALRGIAEGIDSRVDRDQDRV